MAYTLGLLRRTDTISGSGLLGRCGRLKHKLFQRLTEDVGLAKLDKHFAAVLVLMKYAPNWKIFIGRLDHEFPQWGDNLMLPFPDDYTPPPELAE
ncbi:MAG: hypothetical protein ACRD5K_20500 [Candidatus Acidiferrales bacterium]